MEDLNFFVSEIMSRNIISVPPRATVKDVAELMKENNIGSVVVLESGKVVGIVTERDIVVRYVAELSGRTPDTVLVEEIMTRDPITIKENTGLMEAARKMVEKGIRRLIVTNNKGEIVGIVSARDIIRIAPHIYFILSEKLRQARGRPGWGLI